MPTNTTTSSISSHSDDDPINTFSVSGRAVVEWETSEHESHYLANPDPKTRHLTFETSLENDMSQCLSFFRLRIPIRHKHLQDINIYIHIPPDSISSFDWNLQCDVADCVRAKLNTNITRLQFNLHRPAQLVVPNQETLHPKRPLSADVINASKSLAMALCVTIYLEHTTLSKARLQSIAEVIRSGQSRPIQRYCDLHRLYEGIGGKYLSSVDKDSVERDPEVAVLINVDSPPSYDEIGPSPPIPPRMAGSKRQREKRNRQSNGDSTDSGDSPSNRPSKRGILEKYTRLIEPAVEPGIELQLLAERLFAELAQVKAVVIKQGQVIEDLKAEVAKLRDQTKSHQDEIDDLEQRLDKTDVVVVDLETTTIQHNDVLTELEDSTASLQERCDECLSRRAPELEDIKDELRAEVMSRLRNALESP